MHYLCPGILLCLIAGLTSCSSTTPPSAYQKEAFDQSAVFSRHYATSASEACDAARKALLSQGYLLSPGAGESTSVTGSKKYQADDKYHIEIITYVTCTQEPEGATVFANAIQDRYTLRKTNNSASVGLSVLGTVSMPFGSSEDSLVKTGSETITEAGYYRKLFDAVTRQLPQTYHDGQPM